MAFTPIESAKRPSSCHPNHPPWDSYINYINPLAPPAGRVKVPAAAIRPGQPIRRALSGLGKRGFQSDR